MTIAGGPLLSRGLAVALLLGLVGALGIAVAEPLFGLRSEYGQRIAHAERLLVEFERRRVDQTELRRSIAALSDDSAVRSGFFESHNPTLAGVELQSRVKSLVDAAGAQLLTTQTLTSEGKEPFQRVVVRAQLLADVAQMRQIFHAVEGGSPQLFVDNLTLRVPAAAAARRIDDGTTPGNVLVITGDIYGYVWQGDAR